MHEFCTSKQLLSIYVRVSKHLGSEGQPPL